MRESHETPSQARPARRSARCGLLLVGGLVLCAALSGCAALTNPVVNGVPVRKLPPELLGESKEGRESLPLTLLRQPPPAAYKLAAGDILGIWVEGVLGEKGQAPPVRIPEVGNLPPAVGFPVPVRGDGTISLPLVPPLRVDGLTVDQVEELVRKAYTVDRKIFQPGQERILVTLQRPRVYHILVIRQDGGGDAGGGGAGPAGLRSNSRSAGFVINAGGGERGARRGAGFAIDLPAYENDLLNALAQTGGLPGTDAVDEIVIQRGSFAGAAGRDGLLGALQGGAAGPGLPPGGGQRIRIPLRVRPGEEPHLRPQDITLETGDIVFIEAREADVFYTAGLLPAGEYTLPRDTDLDVVEAITRVGGSIDSGGLSTINISGQLITPGFGFPSPSLCSVIRKTPGCGQVVIRVDLWEALRDPRERILIQPRDVIVLQERPEEALARYLSGAFNLSVIWNIFRTSNATGTIAGKVP